jgi:transposase
MLDVETIGRIRRAYFVEKRAIREIVRDLGVSRKTVRKAVREGGTEFRYERKIQPQPQLGLFVERLDALLTENAKRSSRERLTARRVYELLREEGYAGAYDSVQRHVRHWRHEQGRAKAAFVPLWFAPGEAYQFDWSQEIVVLDGVTTSVKVAHVRLCHSRLFLIQAYPRESQEMVFDAHDRAFRFFGGACRRGIYDNMKTAVDAVFVGKERRFNRRFLQLCAHYLVEPVACTPAAGWEKGQVENQVGTSRERLFTPRLRFASYEELNGWLAARCLAHAQETPHPEIKDRTVWSIFEDERPVLVPYAGSFDGFHERTTAASKSCLVQFDRNRYSVAARAANKPVQIHAYADRIVIRLDGEMVGEHVRRFGRDQVAYDPWHYVPVLTKKPGALRNGAPFREWNLPPGLAQIRRRLSAHPDGDRQFVDILSAVPGDGLAAVEAACAEALAAGLFSRDVVLNLLRRMQEPVAPQPSATPIGPRLTLEPIADCARYDRLKTEGYRGAA